MIVEVDQSIKIEQTHKDTVIGIANGRRIAVVIPRKVKRRLRDEFRGVGRRRLFAYRVFIAGVVLALEYANFRNLSDVIIDIEYPGQERLLNSIFLEMWSRRHDAIPTIQFKSIGKRSGAHEVCYQVTRREHDADMQLTYGDIKRLALPRGFWSK